MSTAAARDRSWKSTAERGSVLGIRFVLWLSTAFGRAPARLLVRVIAFYYTLFNGTARRGTRQFLERVGEPPTFGRVYTQILRFAQVTLDALFFVSGKLTYFQIEQEGTEHLRATREKKTGGILLGAHLGSMYAMRAKSGDNSLPVYSVAYTKHAERINGVLREISPDGQAQIIQMGEGLDFMLRIKELVEDGAMVALFGDRVGPGDRAADVEFFGETVPFPVGAYILASMLKCPVFLTFGLYRDPSTYELHCEPFAERVELPRKRRQEALQEYAQQYAARLEHYVRKAPDNWFNFFEFWGSAS